MLDRHLFVRDVDQATRLNIEEVVVAPRIRVEVRAASLNHDLFEETVVIELVEGVVDGGQGHPKASRLSFAVKLFGRHMAVFRTEQKTAERNPLPGRAQSVVSKTFDHVGCDTVSHVNSSRQLQLGQPLPRAYINRCIRIPLNLNVGTSIGFCKFSGDMVCFSLKLGERFARWLGPVHSLDMAVEMEHETISMRIG